MTILFYYLFLLLLYLYNVNVIQRHEYKLFSVHNDYCYHSMSNTIGYLYYIIAFYRFEYTDTKEFQ